MEVCRMNGKVTCEDCKGITGHYCDARSKVDHDIPCGAQFSEVAENYELHDVKSPDRRFSDYGIRRKK
mgnify:FL=1